MTGMMRHIHVILMLLVMLITVTCDAKGERKSSSCGHMIDSSLMMHLVTIIDHTLTIAVQLPLSGYMADMGQRTLSSIQFAGKLT